jgi:pyruvate,water dikinase
MAESACTLFGEICREDVATAGGKGANLGDMVRAGLPVPPGFVICAQVYRKVAENCGLDARIDTLLAELDYSSAEQLRKAEEEIRGLFADVPINGELRAAILERYRGMGADRETSADERRLTDVRVAVRSSATAEDLAGASFAGQQETILNVTGADNLLDAVLQCWSSLYTCQAIFYRHQRGFGGTQVSMAVVIQQMVDAEKSGVIFTVDPVTRNRFNMVIEAVWGLGEGIVSGALTPDHYKVDRETCEVIHEFVPRKPFMYTRGSGCHGVVKSEVPSARVSARVLTDAELRELVDLGNRIEEHFGCPQDIEWGIEGGRIYLLQSRPITCL